MIRPMLIAVVVLGVAGCAVVRDIAGGAEITGNADVTGQVVQRSGQPLAQSSVVVDCGLGTATVTTPTDSAGRYAVNLSAPVVGGRRCVFAVPALAAPRIRVDTAIGFGANGLPHALQLIDLREQ